MYTSDDIMEFLETSKPDSNGAVSIAATSIKNFLQANKQNIFKLISGLITLGASATMSYFLMKLLMKSLDPTNEEKVSSKARAEKIMKLIGLNEISYELNDYELMIASSIILPQNIDCSWQDIGGLENVISDLRETVIYPLKNFDTSSQSASTSTASNQILINNLINKRSRLIQPPKGVLLFGPPGNAKTMIAKALAKESGARFINLQISTLQDKWYGESQKRCEAIFSLARKIQPVIIFIDEIDSFLRSRRSDDHECTIQMKTQFMILWDGLATAQDQKNRIIIIGATNRAEDVDSAILRRMPQMFYIGLPDNLQRKKILGVILKDEHLADDVDLDEIAEKTHNFSGSDLHELCRGAAMNTFIETLKQFNNNNEQSTENETNQETIANTAVIRNKDFEISFQKISVKNLATNPVFSNMRDNKF
jgi:SpoVK/Ycf46/Vps4 family AAA+-type ATPase